MVAKFLFNALPKSIGQMILTGVISIIAMTGLVTSLVVHSVIQEYKDKIVVCSMIIDNTSKE